MRLSPAILVAVLPLLLMLPCSAARADHGWRMNNGFHMFYNDVDGVRYWFYHNDDHWFAWDNHAWTVYAPYRPLAPRGQIGLQIYFGPGYAYQPGIQFYSPSFFGPKKPHPHGGPPGQTSYHPGRGRGQFDHRSIPLIVPGHPQPNVRHYLPSPSKGQIKVGRGKAKFKK